jgi:hypothetical protein
MNHMDFDPHLIRERNEQVHKEVNALRLAGRLRKDRNPSDSRLVALGQWSKFLIGGTRLAE